MQSKHLLTVCTVLTSTASAQVYVGDVSFASPPNTFGHGAVTFLSSLSAGGQGACGFAFDSVNSGGLSTRIGAVNIAELYSLFVVPQGTAFDAAYVSGHSPVTSNSGSLGNFTIPYNGQTVLFAYWDDRAFFGGTGASGEVDASDLFGWMKVAFSQGTDPNTFQPVVHWTILDSATARGAGIIAGTYTQIPEPGSTVAFAGLAGLAGATGMRRRRERS